MLLKTDRFGLSRPGWPRRSAGSCAISRERRDSHQVPGALGRDCPRCGVTIRSASLDWA